MKTKHFFVNALLLLSIVCAPQFLTATLPPLAKNTAAEMQVKERILWGVPTSSYVRVVLVTLFEKNMEFTHKKTMPSLILRAKNEKIDEEFIKCSPLGKIPAYQEIASTGEQFSLTESSVIMDYLDAVEKKHPLRPICAKANARVSYFVNYAGTSLAPLTHALRFENVVKPKVLKQNPDVAKIEKILTADLPQVLDYLESTLSDHRNWIADTKEFTVADIAIASHLVSMDYSELPEISAMGMIGSKRPCLLAYYQKVLARDSFVKAIEHLK